MPFSKLLYSSTSFLVNTFTSNSDSDMLSKRSAQFQTTNWMENRKVSQFDCCESISLFIFPDTITMVYRNFSTLFELKPLLHGNFNEWRNGRRGNWIPCCFYFDRDDFSVIFYFFKSENCNLNPLNPYFCKKLWKLFMT